MRAIYSRYVLLCFTLASALVFADPPSLERAKTALAAGNENAALPALQAVLKTQPNNLFALGNAGLICARKGQLLLAAQYLARAHRLQPKDLQLGLALLEVYARSGRNQEAEQVTADLRAGGKLSSNQIRSAATLLFRSGNLKAAAAMAADDPVDGVLRHDLLASIFTAMGDVQKASDEFQESIRLDPDNDSRYFQLGMLYLKYRTPSLAVLVFGHGLQRRPNSALLWLGLGVSHALDEKLELSEVSLHRAIELNPRFTDAYLLLGDILEQEKPREAL
ncbi:MAG: tetratricopeptide repeat protein, partial [Acidobacteriaceae bacterium]|nr:tetratricopeptide repeat protein [Acidobacteriaceae bacterium]